MEKKGEHILLYDGHCLMCSSLIQWILKRDKKGIIKFAALQDDSIEPLLKNAPDSIRNADSVILYSNEEYLFRTSAIIKVCELLGYPWKILKILRLIPRIISDFVYKIIAKNRRKWFGQSEQCYLVPEDKKYRFLSEPGKKYKA